MQTSDGTSPLVLLVGSNSKQRSRLEQVLTSGGGYRVITATSGREAVRLLHSWARGALVLLHKVLDMTPVQFCQQIQSELSGDQDLPIVIVDDQFDADQAVECLRAGADDYISGPHLEENRVLLARLETALRTHRIQGDADQDPSDAPLVVGSIMIDPAKFRVYVENEACDLTRIQFHLLYTLARRPGVVFSHALLRGTIAKHGGNPDEKSVKSHVFHLRRRLGPAGQQIQTVRGIGYQLME